MALLFTENRYENLLKQFEKDLQAPRLVKASLLKA